MAAGAALAPETGGASLMIPAMMAGGTAGGAAGGLGGSMLYPGGIPPPTMPAPYSKALGGLGQQAAFGGGLNPQSLLQGLFQNQQGIGHRYV
jgi:hypothetical protein